jgi:tetratricopeptide (TPR) repeat protein
MDYLTYAYLQRGQAAKALSVLDDLRAKPELKAADFKIGYAATAMPVRYAIETSNWEEARNIQPIAGAPPQVAAIAYWARAIGSARDANPPAAESELAKLSDCESRLKASGNEYWRTQTHVLLLEAQAWIAQAQGKSDEAVTLLRSAATTEDSVEKLPVTPGPIVPAREQLGELLLFLNRPQQALKEYEVSLANAPGRRGALSGAAQASESIGDLKKAREYRAALH